MLPLQADNTEQLVPCQEALAEVLVENLTRRSGNQGVALLSDRLLKASAVLSVILAAACDELRLAGDLALPMRFCGVLCLMLPHSETAHQNYSSKAHFSTGAAGS